MMDVLRYGSFAIFICFVLVVVYEACLIKLRRNLEAKSKKETDRIISDVRNSEARSLMTAPAICEHQWRTVTEFMRQCRICHAFDLSDTMPEGLTEYLYGRPDPRIGPFNCPGCKRPIPLLNELPQDPFKLDTSGNKPRILECPFCGFDLANWLMQSSTFKDLTKNTLKESNTDA